MRAAGAHHFALNREHQPLQRTVVSFRLDRDYVKWNINSFVFTSLYRKSKFALHAFDISSRFILLRDFPRIYVRYLIETPLFALRRRLHFDVE